MGEDGRSCNWRGCKVGHQFSSLAKKRKKREYAQEMTSFHSVTEMAAVSKKLFFSTVFLLIRMIDWVFFGGVFVCV